MHQHDKKDKSLPPVELSSDGKDRKHKNIARQETLYTLDG
jgi:hypothetical protein